MKYFSGMDPQYARLICMSLPCKTHIYACEIDILYINLIKNFIVLKRNIFENTQSI